MHLLLDEGDEGGWSKGLGLIPGRVQRFDAPPGLSIPHMGFNEVHVDSDHVLLQGIPNCSDFYFIHSFYALVYDTSCVLGTTSHGIQFASFIGKGKVFGVQFHPEKSQSQGLSLLKNFCEL
jgi:glutamine amidotransferase